MLNKEKIILGVDEVGRGPLAGPVIAAAVILLHGSESIPIKDSKKLSEKNINIISDEIKKYSIYKIGVASVEEINNLNILQATMLAMRRAILQIDNYYDVIRIDGNQNPLSSASLKPIELIVKGDSSCRSIAAASIIAKDYRDALMRALSKKYLCYNWHKNKGYGTKKHIEAIKKHGVSDVHRELFCRNLK